MTRFRPILVAIVLLTIASLCSAQASKRKMNPAGKHATHVAVTPDQLKWGPAPPSLPPGAQVAVLQGDPSKPGASFTLRIKFPDGYQVAPHWHPTDENVLVLDGALMLGMGNKSDQAAVRELPAGSYALMPKGVRHFASAKGETTIDVYGVGPFEVIYVNPADDPRHK